MTQSRPDTVFLDSLDGFEFEDLCARIYRELGYRVENIQSTADEGRDLVLKSPDGETIVVECKHWSKGTVGRPVLQKLHSAMLTYPAKRGAVITTGSFAKQALTYIDKVSEDIQLIDLSKLRALAANAGIKLVTGKDSAPLMVYPVGSDKAIKRRLDQAVFNKLTSSPKPASEIFDIKAHDVTWKPAYFIRYSVNQDFSTSVGLLHRERAANETLLIDAEDGSRFWERVANLLKSSRASEISSVPQFGGSVNLPPFVLGATEVKTKAKEHIRDLHTTVVRYQGRNNQTYQKECVPTNKYISLDHITQVYVPQQVVRLAALQSHYSLSFVEGDKDLVIGAKRLDLKCPHCGQHTSGEMGQASETLSTLGQDIRAQICNVCGAITHPAAWMFPHSFRCASCRKTLCRDCAYWVPKLALFKRIICDDCVGSHPVGAARRLTK